MNIEKRHLSDLGRCYAVGSIRRDGRAYLLAASEGRDMPCLSFDCDDFGDRETIWRQPGGTMTIVPVPGTNGEFLAIRKFFRLYDWEEAEVVWAWPDRGGYAVKPLATIPYIHRMDIFDCDGRLYFAGCSLAGRKASPEDWTSPGRVYTATLDPRGRRLCDLGVWKDGLYKNHGYFRVKGPDGDYGLIGCDQGIFRLDPPRGGGDWRLTRLTDLRVSDMALEDLDGDGELELAVIEDFHGRYFRIYKLGPKGWECVFQHPETTEFYHVVWSGRLAGRPAVIGGCRRGKQQLFIVTADGHGGFEVRTVDEGVGPSNIHVLHRRDCDWILSANNEIGEVAVYIVSGERSEA